MANSKVIITFLEVPAVNYQFSILEETLVLDLFEKFKANRLAAKQVDLPEGFDISQAPDPPQYVYSHPTSQAYKTAFDIDYNNTGLFTVTTTPGTGFDGLGTVTIEANYPGAVFTYDDDFAGVIDVVITNEAAVAVIAIDSIDYSEAATFPCKQVLATIATSILATKVLSPEVINPNTDNPFALELLRGTSYNVLVEDANGAQASQVISTPDHLIPANFTININNSPSGASVTIVGTNTNGLTLEYSLDGATWQSSNIFPNLAQGTFTAYVRDNFGCSFTKPFTVTLINFANPSFYVPKANSIRFANRITFGDAANYKKAENTLSCEAPVLLPYKEVQQFQTADIITTQFQSNYALNEAKVVKADLTEDTIAVVKKTNNIGVKDKKDGFKYSLGGGKIGIYFTTGNNYDYNTNTVTGVHTLYGSLPEWGVIGNYFSIGGTYYLIENIFYDESKNADVLVATETYGGAEIPVIVGCVYNSDGKEYEVYEFVIDMATYQDQRIRVKILATDPNFTPITYLSEEIDVYTKRRNCPRQLRCLALCKQGIKIRTLFGNRRGRKRDNA